MALTWEEACKILGVSPDATAEEIKEKYLYKVQLLHPDHTMDRPEKIRLQAEEELKQVNVAYEVLKDETNNPFRNPPKLEISPSQIRFRNLEPGQTKTTSFEIRSIGGPFTKININQPTVPWLSIVDLKSLTDKPLPMEAIIEASGILDLGERASYSLGVHLENAITQTSDVVNLKIELSMKPAPMVATKPISGQYPSSTWANPTNPQSAYVTTQASSNTLASSKNRAALLAWFVFFCVVGAHRFYAGRPFSAVAQIVCYGVAVFSHTIWIEVLFFGWLLVDLVTILSGNFKDNGGYKITRWRI